VQLVSSSPAFTVGAGVSERVRLSVTEPEQGINGFAVMVSTTLPLATSEAAGLYTGFRTLALLNVPVPEVVQVIKE
jgi:hypothetical protein